MTLAELTLFLCLLLIGFQFWRIRSISERANLHIQQYCQTHQLQLLSVARRKTRLSFKYAKIDWHSVFVFEFSWPRPAPGVFLIVFGFRSMKPESLFVSEVGDPKPA